MKQRDIFRASEGDQYFRRNPVDPEGVEVMGDRDPLVRSLGKLGLRPKRVLEVGAGNGWRLAYIKLKNPEVTCCGLEPSTEAVRYAAEHFPGISVERGTAEALPYAEQSFDLVILGFCLYLCDREDLFRIASEADRVLCDEGHIAILDFFSETPETNTYVHSPGVYSYKMDYSKMFLWSPLYRLVAQDTMPYPGTAADGKDRWGVSVLQRVRREHERHRQ